MMTDWKNDIRNVVSHSLAFSGPHSMLYNMVKNPGTIILKTVTEKVKHTALDILLYNF